MVEGVERAGFESSSAVDVRSVFFSISADAACFCLFPVLAALRASFG